jgi:hypothetical protein
MKPLHFTQHGTRKSGDALDLFGDENDVLGQLFAKWDTTTPHKSQGAQAVLMKWDHGTIGKLILEHAAVRLAAADELARVLRDIGRTHEASQLEEEGQALRPVLDQMYEDSRGVQPVSASIEPGFVEAANQLQELLRPKIGGARQDGVLSELTEALGSERSRLRGAKFIRKHAPAHPGSKHQWYDRVPILLRFHAISDRVRGFPWGESRLGDRKLAQRYDREV